MASKKGATASSPVARDRSSQDLAQLATQSDGIEELLEGVVEGGSLAAKPWGRAVSEGTKSRKGLGSHNGPGSSPSLAPKPIQAAVGPAVP